MADDDFYKAGGGYDALREAMRLAMPQDYRNPLLHPEAVNHFALPPQQPRAELRNPAPRPGEPTANFEGDQAKDIRRATRQGHKVVTWGGPADKGGEIMVLDPTVIEILRKYGLLGPVAAGATANALMGDKNEQ